MFGSVCFSPVFDLVLPLNDQLDMRGPPGPTQLQPPTAQPNTHTVINYNFGQQNTLEVFGTCMRARTSISDALMCVCGVCVGVCVWVHSMCMGVKG